MRNLFYQVCLTERNGDATQLLPYMDSCIEATEIASRLRAYLATSHYVELLRHIETGDGEGFENSSIETAKLTF